MFHKVVWILFIFLRCLCTAIQEFKVNPEMEGMLGNLSCLVNENCPGWSSLNSKVWMSVDDLTPGHPATTIPGLPNVFMLAIWDTNSKGRGALRGHAANLKSENVLLETELFFSTDTLSLTINQGVDPHRKPIFISTSDSDKDTVRAAEWYNISLEFQVQDEFQLEFNVNLQDGEYMAVKNIVLQYRNHPDTTFPSTTESETDESIFETSQSGFKTSPFVFETSQFELKTSQTISDTLQSEFQTSQASSKTSNPDSDTSNSGSETSNSGTETMKPVSETSETRTPYSETSQLSTETSKSGTETSKPDSEISQTDSETSKPSSGTWSPGFDISNSDYQTTKSEIETSYSVYESSKTDLETSKPGFGTASTTGSGYTENEKVSEIATTLKSPSALKSFGWPNVLLLLLVVPLGLVTTAAILSILQITLQSKILYTRHSDDDFVSVQVTTSDGSGTQEL